MKTSDIELKYAVSKETLRYYIERDLITPACINNSFTWSEQDESDLQTILYLREMGLSIEGMIKLKQTRDEYPGLQEKLIHRMQILKDEIEEVEVEQRELAYRKQKLEYSLQLISQEILSNEESN